VVAKEFYSFLENHPLINKLWMIDKKKWKQLSRIRDTFSEIRNLKRELEAEKYDIVIDLQGLFRSGLITSFTKAPYRLGFKNAKEGASFFYNFKDDSDWLTMHAVDRYLKILEFLDIKTPNKPNFILPKAANDFKLLKELPKEYAVITPSAGKSANRWAAEKFGQLAAKLTIPSLVIAGPGDMEIAEKVVANSNGKAISLAGKTKLLDLIPIIKNAKLFFSNDTGPMHIAAALDTPVFAVFGPANPIKTGPYGDNTSVVQLDLPCIPCYAKRKCEHWECINGITVEMVVKAVANKMPQFILDEITNETNG
jgi:lipopolysaccharide heptosyltransferase II